MRIVTTLVLCLTLGRLFAAPPPEPQQGQLDASKSLFAVLAAINVAGYDAEIDSPTNHPFRNELRQELAKRNLKSLRWLKEFFAEHRKDDWNDELGQYISYALSVDGPPDFKWRYPTDRTPPAASALEPMGALLKQFWEEAELEKYWQRAQPAFDAMIARYHEPLTNAVLQDNGYLRNPTSGSRGRRFQIFVDVLGAPNQVHARGFVDDYFVVVTPSVQLRVADVRRAYLHYLIDPMAIRASTAIEKKKKVCALAERAPALSELYKQDCVLLAGQSLVRAVESRMDHAPAKVEEAMREGYVFTAYFAEALVFYEKQEISLRLLLPEMIDAINVKREERRIEDVAFVDKPAVHMVKVETLAAPVKSAVEVTLEAADKQLKARDFEAARTLYRQALEQAAAKRLQARASFGLAQVAGAQKDFELAEQLFQKTLASEPDAFEKAWSLVHLGRLALSARETAQALQFFEAALAVDGGSAQARQAAQSGKEAALAAKP